MTLTLSSTFTPYPPPFPTDLKVGHKGQDAAFGPFRRRTALHGVDLGAHQPVQVLLAGHQGRGQGLVQERAGVLGTAHVLGESHQDVHHAAGEGGGDQIDGASSCASVSTGCQLDASWFSLPHLK